MFLTSLELDRSHPLPQGYPFSLPPIATLTELELTKPVTFFAGENGSGKSTLLEALAQAAGSIAVRGDDAATERVLTHTEALAARLRLRWKRKTRRGFFLRAEDFFDYSKGLARDMEEMSDLADDFEARFSGYGRRLARGSVLGQRRAMAERYGDDPHARSHGESFLQFFQARFTGEGLYLLDEPDTALSAQSVLGLLAMLMEMVREGAQFIVATHSPLLLALPGASIISFDRSPIEEVPYDEVEQVVLMRSFLAQPQAFLRHI